MCSSDLADALVHTARQFGGMVMLKSRQADEIDKLHGPPLTLVLRNTFELQREGNIVDRGQPGH